MHLGMVEFSLIGMSEGQPLSPSPLCGESRGKGLFGVDRLNVNDIATSGWVNDIGISD
jgi:hypothetical protein